MVSLLVLEHDAQVDVRPTIDVDVIVDIRAYQRGTSQIAAWLESQEFAHDGMSPEGIGHRYVRDLAKTDNQLGQVIFDILAPEGGGHRASLGTTPPARTVEVPGGTQALRRAEVINIDVQDVTGLYKATGSVRRPSILGAIIAKASATTIATRANPERDWQDLAHLLAIVPDPVSLKAELKSKDRQRLRKILELEDREHTAWQLLSTDQYRRAIATLDFLLGD